MTGGSQSGAHRSAGEGGCRREAGAWGLGRGLAGARASWARSAGGPRGKRERGEGSWAGEECDGPERKKSLFLFINMISKLFY